MSSDATHTFRSEDGIFEFTIKKEFLAIADPSKHSTHKLMTEFKVGNYLHNPFGPAITNLKNGYQEFWLEGKRAPADVAEKIKHQTNFNNDLEQLLK
jgi:hypothetical protein